MFRFTLAAAALVAMTLVACGNSDPAKDGGAKKVDGKQKVIGITIMTAKNPFFVQLADAAKAEAEKNGFKAIIRDGANDADKQASQIQDFIEQGVDAILLTPCNAQLAGAAVQEANRAGIPVFTADTGVIDEKAQIVCHIATDNYAGGKQAGVAMIEALGGKGGKILVLDYKVAQSCLQRVKGFKEVVDAHNTKNPSARIVIVAELPGEASRDPSSKAAADVLEKNKDLVGVFAINDPSALGAVAAIEAAGLQKQVKVIGFDGQRIGKEAIKEGKIYADPIQFPEQMGRMSVQKMVEFFEGKRPEKQILIPTALYRKADAEKDPDLK